MTEFSEGDLIEATKGETVIRGRLNYYTSGDLWVGDSVRMLETLQDDNGWTFALVEKAAPALPTEPGWYSGAVETVWRLTRNGHGEPEWLDNQGFHHVDDVKEYAPFTRLEPVADTAKKVLAAVNGQLESASRDYYQSRLDKIATEFGVTS